MSSFTTKAKLLFAHWILMVFALGLLSILIFSEFFQYNLSSQGGHDLLTRPIKADILANIQTIQLKNRLGKFTVTLDPKGQWKLVEPRRMATPLSTVEKILESLDNISIHTLHEDDPLNRQNFALDNPGLIIDLHTKLDENIQLKMGLINPINDTSYISVSDQKVILQIDNLKHKLELLDVSDFVDSKIFGHSLDEVKELKIYHGASQSPFNHLKRNDGEWTSQRYRVIKNESVNNVIRKLLDVQSHMIVDNETETVKNFMKNYFENPLYRVEIINNNDESTNYTITRIINSMPEVKVSNKQYFLINSSQRLYPHLIHKDYLERFTIRYDHLK